MKTLFASLPFKFLFSLLTVFALSLSVGANQTKMYKVGLSVWSGYPASVQGFKDAMAAEGFVEGENVEYIYGNSGGDKAQQRVIVEQFKSNGMDLVYSLTTPGTSIVKEVMPTETPIVFSIVTYPADSGLIDSFEYSGNNLVGTSNYVPLRHYLSLLKKLLPTAKRVAIFHRKGEPNSKIQSANLSRMLKSAGLEVLDREPASVDEVRSMATALVGTADVFISTTDTLMQGGGEKELIDVSLANGIPILSSNKSGIEAGSTFGPVADFYTLGKMSGHKAAKILLENLQPWEMESELQDPPLTLINRGSADAIGISVPDNMLGNVEWAERS